MSSENCSFRLFVYNLPHGYRDFASRSGRGFGQPVAAPDGPLRGLTLHRTRNYGTGAAAYEEALRLRRRVFGDEHALVSATLVGLGEVTSLKVTLSLT